MKRKIIIISGIVLLLIVFLAYLVFAAIFIPVNAHITADRPIIKLLCELQVRCNSVVGDYVCGYGTGTSDEELRVWKGYHGCNESTAGFGTENGYKWITVESCVCGSLM